MMMMKKMSDEVLKRNVLHLTPAANKLKGCRQIGSRLGVVASNFPPAHICCIFFWKSSTHLHVCFLGIPPPPPDRFPFCLN